MTDTIALANLTANRTTEIAALRDGLTTELVANDLRFARAAARLFAASTAVPAVLGFLNAVGVL